MLRSNFNCEGKIKTRNKLVNIFLQQVLDSPSTGGLTQSLITFFFVHQRNVNPSPCCLDGISIQTAKDRFNHHYEAFAVQARNMLACLFPIERVTGIPMMRLGRDLKV